MKKKIRKPAWLVDHEKNDNRRFDALQNRQDKFILVVSEAVGKAVDEKINGKLIGIKNQLDKQNTDMEPVVKAFKDDKVVSARWDNDLKKVVLYTGAGGGVITIIGAIWWVIKNIRI